MENDTAEPSGLTSRGCTRRVPSQVPESSFRVTSTLIVGYLAIQVLANLTVRKQTPLFGVLNVPVGSLLYALSFTWIDLVNDYLGKARARWLVLLAIFANVIMILWFELYIALPGTALWKSDPVNQVSIERVLGGVWRIYGASLLTNYVTENTDITVFHMLKKDRETAPRWQRSLLSNSVSAPLDGVLFPCLAFIGVLPGSAIVSIVLSSALYKLVVGYLSIPILYLVPSRRERGSLSFRQGSRSDA